MPLAAALSALTVAFAVLTAALSALMVDVEASDFLSNFSAALAAASAFFAADTVGSVFGGLVVVTFPAPAPEVVDDDVEVAASGVTVDVVTLGVTAAVDFGVLVAAAGVAANELMPLSIKD